MAGDEWRCRKHPAPPCGGVCPYCLRDRLLRLCPECAHTRPCPCAASSSSPSSSSSSAASGSAAVGRVYSLIERERRMGLRSRSVAAGGGGGRGIVRDERPKSRAFGWVSFRKATSDRVVEVDDGVALARSSSVSATAVETRPPPKARGWGRFIPGSIKALRHRKSRAAADYREGSFVMVIWSTGLEVGTRADQSVAYNAMARSLDHLAMLLSGCRDPPPRAGRHGRPGINFKEF
uniref:Uncharacterized protein n=1 Tax=Oryza punctata TaxID=4537 RepID=A0A0E0KUJ4_ORYPU